jgi:DNA-binding response OmpR family regulator
LLTRAAAQAKALIPDEIRIKLAEGSILVNEHPIPLTRQEFTIVLALAAQRHQFTSRQTLLLFLYGDSEEDSSNSRIVTVLISSVRSKLRDAIGRDMIAHVPEKGFCLRDSFHEVAPAAPPARWVLDDGHIEALISSVGPEDSLAQDHNT